MIIIFFIIIILIFFYFWKDNKRILEYINQILKFKLEINKKSNTSNTIINQNTKIEKIKIIKRKKYKKRLSKTRRKSLPNTSERKSLPKNSLILINSNLETNTPKKKVMICLEK